MSSRQDEKDRRRQERLQVERDAAATRARMRRLQAGLGALLVIAIVIGVVLALTGGGNGGAQGKGPQAPAATADRGAAIPPPGQRDLAKAAAAAGCVLLDPRIEGREHTLGDVTYHTNPPSSGPHNPVPALDGIYAPGNTPTPEHYVHSLEHGRIEFQYAPGTSSRRIAQLETLAGEPLHGKPGYKVLLFENNTHMKYAVAATAWGHIIGCRSFRPQVFDALRDFRSKWVDKGPEIGIPPTN